LSSSDLTKLLDLMLLKGDRRFSAWTVDAKEARAVKEILVRIPKVEDALALQVCLERSGGCYRLQINNPEMVVDVQREHASELLDYWASPECADSLREVLLVEETNIRLKALDRVYGNCAPLNLSDYHSQRLTIEAVEFSYDAQASGYSRYAFQ
jgi:hypothetical protein